MLRRRWPGFIPVVPLSRWRIRPGKSLLWRRRYFHIDALGRQKTTTHSDGASVQVSYAGRATQITDEGNNAGGTTKVSRILQSDALGHTVGVCEIYSGTALMGSSGTPAACGLEIAGTGYITYYAHNTLDNLTGVTQGGLTRSYQYDSLSRVTQETIPEKSGVTNYTYNSDSLLYQRTRPAPNQTNAATTVTTTYSYDALHRPVYKTFSDGTTPGAAWYYDETTAWGSALANTVGRLSRETTGSGSTGMTFSYDPMGRVVQNKQCTPRTCFGSSYSAPYSYDLMGNPLTATNGLGTTFTSGYNVAARLTGLAGRFGNPARSIYGRNVWTREEFFQIFNVPKLDETIHFIGSRCSLIQTALRACAIPVERNFFNTIVLPPNTSNHFLQEITLCGTTYERLAELRCARPLSSKK